MRKKININLFMKILGYQTSKGTYQGIPYNNVNLFVQDNELASSPDGQEIAGGIHTERYKIKFDVFADFMAKNSLSWSDLLGLNICIYFNKYNKVDYIGIING